MRLGDVIVSPCCPAEVECVVILAKRARTAARESIMCRKSVQEERSETPIAFLGIAIPASEYLLCRTCELLVRSLRD
jgi:hypothetical protein